MLVRKNQAVMRYSWHLNPSPYRLKLVIHWNYRVVRYFEYFYLSKHWLLFIICESKLALGKEGNGRIIDTINSRTINSVDTPCL